MYNVTDFADMINKDCEEYRYFWAYGLVRETLVVWEKPSNLEYLCDIGKMMVGDAKEGKRGINEIPSIITRQQ